MDEKLLIHFDYAAKSYVYSLMFLQTVKFKNKKVKIGNDQEMAQSEKNPTPHIKG